MVRLTVEDENLKGVRKVRNAEYDRQDLLSIVEGTKCPASVLDAYGALYQANCEVQLGDYAWCVFSSRLGPLVSGVRPEGSVYGTIKEHILAASHTGTPDELISKTRWVVPLCGGDPLHWVLAWVDYSKREIGMFDSIPELGSSSWAEPLLLSILDKIRETLNACPIVWNDGGWSRIVAGPSLLQRQFDVWSCGIFAMMALQALTQDDTEWRDVGDDHKFAMRELMLKTLLEIPARHAPVIEDDCRNYTIIETGPNSFEAVSEDDPEFLPGSTPSVTPSHFDQSKLTVITGPKLFGALSKSAATAGDAFSALDGSSKKRPHSDGVDDGYNTEDEKSKKQRSRAAQIPRRNKKSNAERRAVLENDEWTLEAETQRVKCRGCTKWIALQGGSRTYDLKNWVEHKKSCSQITGTVTRRIRFNQTAATFEPPAGVKPLSSYFVTKPPRELCSNPLRITPTSPSSSTKPGTYTTQRVAATPSIGNIFVRAAPKLPVSSKPVKPSPSFICQHLSGPRYNEYILRAKVRSLGGISFEFRARAIRQLTPWKNHPPLTEDRTKYKVQMPLPPSNVGTAVPEDGNLHVPFQAWTLAEKKRLDNFLEAFARWEVNTVDGFVRSTHCEKTTQNSSRVCVKCMAVAKDTVFLRAVQRKNNEAQLPLDEQHAIHVKREKFGPQTFTTHEARKLQQKMDDPLVFNLWSDLQHGREGKVFINLYRQVREGKLKGFASFTAVCEVLSEQVQRQTSDNPNLKYGIRYPQDYMNFMTLLRSYGSNSARQFGIITGALGGPSFRSMRRLIANSEDALQNPALIFENMARVKRFVDLRKYTGPIAVAGDCTKVRPRLTYSNDYGGHILGSILPLSECEVDDIDDIDEIIKRVKALNAMATQVPLPEYEPVVVALVPTTGKEAALDIHQQHMQILKMAEKLGLQIVALGADAAACELAAQSLMDAEVTDCPHLTYEYPLYGLSLRVPVFSVTGPLVSVSDPPHARKTARNQAQHGTKTASMGVGHFVNKSLVDLCSTPGSGMMLRDVKDTDKQDDGAARRLFHHSALTACTLKSADGKDDNIKDGCQGIFVYLFIFGSLFDAWMNRRMSVNDRVLLALRARFFLHLWRQHIVTMSNRFPDLYSLKRSFISPASFNIFNRLCDTLIELALVFSRHYPTHPFCPWLLGTDFVEHFFGLSRGTDSTGTEEDLDEDIDMEVQQAPLFSCHPSPSMLTHLHTHSPALHLLYNLGNTAFIPKVDPRSSHRTLTDAAAKRWLAFTNPQAQKVLTILIPARKAVSSVDT
ncbi:hypothetical protein D9615_009847 [Tricholomella constricta]|uniref:Ubiquitin-like protease family profile domain-containing protein n=1 Tax=Tricholomella constricta TaxID=117010 RepID=A0A8H5GX36_9AGAR|nr:hypothetical protein D9615_009847 [Tricholomella constricta]